MDLTSATRILRRRLWLLAALTAIGLLVGGWSWTTQRTSDTFYRATHTLLTTGGDVNLDRAAAVATIGQVPERAAARLGDVSAGQLAAQVRVTPRQQVGFLDVTAFGADPEQAVESADVMANELSVYMSELESTGQEGQIASFEQRLGQITSEMAELRTSQTGELDPAALAEIEARIDARQTEASELESEIDRLRSRSLDATVLETFSTAEAVPISGPQLRELFRSSGADADGPDPAAAVAGSAPLGLVPRLVLGGGFGFLLGVGAAFALERLDPRIRTKDETERVFGWPVLTEVPPLDRAQQEARAVLASSAPRSRTAEAYRVLRSSVMVALSGAAPLADGDELDVASDGDGSVVLVTSASPSEGKTTTVANLATVLGEAGHRVLVVNCDFRRPTLGTYLGVDPHLARVVPTDVPNVSLLAQVTDDPEDANPAEVIAMQRDVVAEARRRFDIVLLDTAPLLTTNDANDVLGIADLIVVVARAGRTTSEAADRCAETLERRSAPVLGVVLVAAADAPNGRYYYYGDYYLDDGERPTRGTSGTEQPEASDDASDNASDNADDESGPEGAAAGDGDGDDASEADPEAEADADDADPPAAEDAPGEGPEAEDPTDADAPSPATAADGGLAVTPEGDRSPSS